MSPYFHVTITNYIKQKLAISCTPSSAKLGIGDDKFFAYFDLCMEVRVMFDHITCDRYEKFGSSVWSFSWFGQKVNKFEVKGYVPDLGSITLQCNRLLLLSLFSITITMT